MSTAAVDLVLYSALLGFGSSLALLESRLRRCSYIQGIVALCCLAWSFIAPTKDHVQSVSLTGIVVMHDRRMPQNRPSVQIVCQRLPQTDRGRSLRIAVR